MPLNSRLHELLSLWEQAWDEGRDLPPDELLAGQELMEAITNRLSSEEAELAQRRMQGMSWGEIATELGGSADGRRMQLARAAERLARDLKAHR